MYHELNNVAEICHHEEISIPRAAKLVEAVVRQQDYSLVKVLRHPAEGSPSAECLIVDVVCDGVPPMNSVGIKYRERLALCVPRNPSGLIEVLALRKDFPITMHQNQGISGAPSSLCLYFEGPLAVMRTWTPQAFLRRIQWWLTQTSRGELHPADQPVEQLFFASKCELILPWNLEALRKEPNQHFAVFRADDRPDGSFTCFLKSCTSAPDGPSTVTHIEITLPSVIHGFIEHDPVTLGQLVDMLSRRNIDLTTPLKTALQERAKDGGVPCSSDDKGTLILLRIPICRDEGSVPESISYRAFFVNMGSLALGVTMGVIFRHDGIYCKDTLNHASPSTWVETPVLAMSVLIQNTDASARLQSGITQAGPKGVIIGAGSLGSALINLWGRSGWGRWTIIDKDHLKPHNLSRHVGFAHQIGEPKATILAGLHMAATEGATEVVPVVADACDLTISEVSKALETSELVIDASTTLEYPRMASVQDSFPRHISTFITPNGHAAVLLAEDANRTMRLRSLEAQYYRALIHEDWGKVHLADHARTFWSGTGCRDISMVMPYSHILGQASTLAEQVILVVASKEASIRVWQRDPIRGGVQVHDVPVRAERCFEIGDLNIFLDDGIAEKLKELRSKNFPNETGGALLGIYDFNIMALIVVDALPAPPDSKGTPASFERGVNGLAEAVDIAGKRTAGMVGYIGEWHSHPPGHSAAPSGYDLTQLAYLAARMAEDGLPAIQLIVGERDIRVLRGEVV